MKPATGDAGPHGRETGPRALERQSRERPRAAPPGSGAWARPESRPNRPKAIDRKNQLIRCLQLC